MEETANENIIRRTLDTADENPGVQLAEIIAEIEETDPVDLPTMYECVDGMLDNLFSHPPAREAQMSVEFSYGTYRVTIEQDGAAKLVKTE